MSDAADIAVGILRGMGYANAYSIAPSAAVCAEPIVLVSKGWEREARFADGSERGREGVSTIVCCDSVSDARATAFAVERDLRRVVWNAVDGVRIVSVDTDMPRSLGRDSSGRWLWGFTLSCVVVRNFDRQDEIGPRR